VKTASSDFRCLSLHVTDLCNSKCTFCVVGSPLYVTDTIQYEALAAFLRTNANCGFEVVNLHGGEATIYPRFIELLELINSLGYREIHLQTNAIRLADAEFAERIVGLGVTTFIISLHGDTPEIHDSQTHSHGGFKRTILGIRHVKSLSRQVRTNTVITSQNFMRLADIVRLAISLEVDHINFSNLHPVGSSVFSRQSVMPSLTAVQPYLYSAIDLALESGRIVTLEGFPYCSVREKLDLHLDHEYRQIRMLMRGVVIDDYDCFMNDRLRIFGPSCKNCAARGKCGGVYPEYIEYKGWNEFIPL